MARIYKIANYCNATARRNCKYIFGSFLIDAKINQNDRVFDVQLHKTLPVRQTDGSIKHEPIENYVNIKKYKDFWGPQWRLTFIKSEEV
jgi:hypothetical protein